MTKIQFQAVFVVFDKSLRKKEVKSIYNENCLKLCFSHWSSHLNDSNGNNKVSVFITEEKAPTWHVRERNLRWVCETYYTKKNQTRRTNCKCWRVLKFVATGKCSKVAKYVPKIWQKKWGRWASHVPCRIGSFLKKKAIRFHVKNLNEKIGY